MGMDYSLVQRIIDGSGKILDTKPGSPDEGTYVTEQQLADWIKGQTVVSAYYYNGVMYSDALHTTPITGQAGALYIDQDNNVLYRWDGAAWDAMSDNQLRQDILDGTVVAKKAECDQNGNTIDSTYATKTEMQTADANLNNAISALQKQIDNITEAEDLLSDVDYANGENAVPANVSEYAEVGVLKGVGRVDNRLPLESPRDVSTTGVTITYNSSTGKFTITGQAVANSSVWLSPFDGVIAGHVYLIGNTAPNVKMYLANISEYGQYILPTALATSQYLGVRLESGKTYNDTFEVIVKDISVYFGTLDLSWIGSTYAERIATIQQNYPELLEPSAYGTEVVFPTYSAVKSRGVNIWDEEWETGTINSTTGQNEPNSSLIRSKNYIPVTQGVDYFFLNRSVSIYAYDANKNYLGNASTTDASTGYVVSTTGVRYLRFRTVASYGTTYKHDIQICPNSYADKTTYHPYMTDTLTLPTPVTLKGAGSVSEMYYPESGRVTHPIGSYTFTGQEEWEYIDTFTNPAFRLYYTAWDAVIPDAKVGNMAVLIDEYVTVPSQASWGNISAQGDKVVGCVLSVAGIVIRDDTYNGNLAGFKAHIAGKTMHYELANPAPDTYVDPILDPYIKVEPNGTIETVQSQSPKIDGAMTVTYTNKVSA